MKKLLMITLALAFAVVLAACGGEDAAEEGNQETPESTSEQAQESVEVTEKEKVDETESVAKVNDAEVTGEKYNPIYMQVKTTMQQSGQDISDHEKIKELTLDLLVDQELILQDAERAGIEVTEEEVDQQYKQIEEQSGDQLPTMLEQFQLTEEQFKDQLNNDLITSKYMESELNVEVTDQEVQEMYDQLTEQSEEVGELKELEEPIRQQLRTQKEQEQLKAKVEELKEDADVETLI
ncbi:SurA N-terminal domain-containing protein [Virgibacillus xinjiangensis]|uniref:SurA N-terminal domain-containing protein n=1 Tax=Virgibacillus xinjiangensis TaxID=393090 RepID=A0ABV7CUL9_9BACI